ALGANAVSIGRLYLYGLAAAGQAGVQRVLELLEAEIQIALGLLGVTSLSDLDRSCLQPVAPVNPPHVFSAFPLLEITEALRGRYEERGRRGARAGPRTARLAPLFSIAVRL